MYSVCFELQDAAGQLLHEVRECYPHGIVSWLSIYKERGLIPAVVGMYRVNN